MTDISTLERALTYSKTQPDDIAVFILRGAIDSFLSAKKAYPVSTSTPLSRLLQETKSDGCPLCGQRGAHYCVGRGSTGIEYWYNQPTALANTRNSVYAKTGGGRGIAQGSGQG